MRGGNNIVRRRYVTIYDYAKEFDVDISDRFRAYRGKYPREGYDKTKDNPLLYPKDERKPPPLRH